MNNDDQIIKSLISGGLIGASLGALISKDQEIYSLLSAISRAVLLATFKASEQARKNNLSFLFVQNGKVYETQPGGGKKFIKDLPKQKKDIPQHFKLR